MNIGTISYEAHSGLGHLARSFFHNKVVNRILVIRHPHYPNFTDWYPPNQRFTLDTVRRFLDGLDLLLLFENAFYWEIAERARDRGIKIVMIPNYEYTPFPPKVLPDLWLCASLLDMGYYREWPTAFLPIPLDTTKVPWKLRTTAKTFIHNAGHGGRGYREGTPELLEAMQYVRSPIQLIIRGQPEEKRMRQLLRQGCSDPRVELVVGEQPGESDLWTVGDVCVAPQKYNGMSLPLEEAYGAGMLVMTTNRFPMNTWLPTEPMIPVERYELDRIAVIFERAVVTSQAIAETMDAWYNQDITEFSIRGREWALANSWSSLRPQYLAVLESVMEGASCL